MGHISRILEDSINTSQRDDFEVEVLGSVVSQLIRHKVEIKQKTIFDLTEEIHRLKTEIGEEPEIPVNEWVYGNFYDELPKFKEYQIMYSQNQSNEQSSKINYNEHIQKIIGEMKDIFASNAFLSYFKDDKKYKLTLSTLTKFGYKG